MKAFVVCIIFIILIVTIVILNMLYVRNVAENMKRLTLEVSKDQSSDTAMSELMEYWDKHKDIVGISSSFKQTDIVSEELLKLSVAHSLNNRFAIEQSCAIVCDVLDDIAQYESLSIHSIL